MTELNLSPQQAQSFIDQVHPSRVETTPEGLRRFIQSVLAKVPFTNIMMLVRPRKSPTKEEIIEDMLFLRGGPCGHYNPFMNEIFNYLGFDSGLAPAWMKGEMSHIAIVLYIGEEKWWIDCGNGHPYLSPIRIGSDEIKTHAGLSYRIVEANDGRFAVQHRHSADTEFLTNYEFVLKRVPFSHFDQMVHAHYTNPEFGPFLQGLRFIRFPDSELLAVRDRSLLKTTTGMLEKRDITGTSELERIIELNFPSANYPISEGMEALGWC